MQTVKFKHRDPLTGTKFNVTAEISPVYFNEDYEWTGSGNQLDVWFSKIEDMDGHEVALSDLTCFQKIEMQNGALDVLARMPELEPVGDDTQEVEIERAYAEYRADAYLNECKAA